MLLNVIPVDFQAAFMFWIVTGANKGGRVGYRNK
jgi:hypothetical protein